MDIGLHKYQPWRLRPKAHLLQHLSADKLEVFGSPSACWCYGDEDFVGTIKDIVAKTKYPSTLEWRTTQKLMLREGLMALGLLL